MPSSSLIRNSRLIHLIGFALAAVAALHDGWTVQQLCWSFWISALITCWGLVAAAVIRLIIQPAFLRSAVDRLQQITGGRLSSIPTLIISALIFIAMLGLCFAAYRAYSFLFAFYGLFLSAFAPIEPAEYFGPNGFINSNFYDPVLDLIERFWPMIIGTLIAEWPHLVSEHPLKNLSKPFQTQLVRLHLAVLGVPFISMFAWILLGEHYQIIAVVLILAVFYYTPENTKEGSHT